MRKTNDKVRPRTLIASVTPIISVPLPHAVSCTERLLVPDFIVCLFVHALILTKELQGRWYDYYRIMDDPA